MVGKICLNMKSLLPAPYFPSNLGKIRLHMAFALLLISSPKKFFEQTKL